MDMKMWHEEAKGVIRELRELAALTADENGAHRVAWTPVWDRAISWFQEKMIRAGAEITVDAANNVWAKLPGESAEGVLIGSHLDSVPNGGWLDGALGVAAGMGIMEYYGKRKKRPKKTLYVVNWADEEGARFGVSCVGSAAVSGSLDAAAVARLVDANGISFAEALEHYQRKAEDFPKAREQFLKKQIGGYLELHIEQAPVLEHQGKAVACVYGITGCERQYITFTGQPSHAGSPISMRQDAFLAAAQAALAFREIGQRNDAYCTVGKVSVAPDVVTIFPGKCTISLDQRAIDAKVLEKIYAAAHAACLKAAEDNQVKVAFEPVWSIPPTIFDERLKMLCQAAVEAETGEATTMFSGPLHDAAEMAKILPAIMMFAMSSGGLSHCKEENTPDAVLETAIAAFLRLAVSVVDA